MRERLDQPTATRSRALLRALASWVILCTGIGLSVTITRAVDRWVTLGPFFVPVLQAVLVSALVVPAIVILRRTRDHKALAGIGLSRHWLVAAGVGAAVGLGVGAVVWLPALWAGWIRLDHLDPMALIMFIAVNTVVLLLYEALPEEIALRGYGWTNVREAWTPLVATLTITLLFCLSSALISVIQTVSAILLDVEASAVSLVPGGNDPVAYLLQIVLFGLALVAARRLPLRGALAAAITFHIVQLTINRVLLGGLSWIASGVDVEFVTPDAIALVLVHIALAGIVFMVLRLFLERPSWRRALSPRR